MRSNVRPSSLSLLYLEMMIQGEANSEVTKYPWMLYATKEELSLRAKSLWREWEQSMESFDNAPFSLRAEAHAVDCELARRLGNPQPRDAFASDFSHGM